MALLQKCDVCRSFAARWQARSFGMLSATPSWNMSALPSSILSSPVRRERRKSQRLPIAIPVFLRGLDGRGKAFIEFASAVNVSAGGMLVAVRRILPVASRLSLEIPSAPVPASDCLPVSTRLFKVKVLRAATFHDCQYVALKFARSVPVDSPE